MSIDTKYYHKESELKILHMLVHFLSAIILYYECSGVCCNFDGRVVASVQEYRYGKAPDKADGGF